MFVDDFIERLYLLIREKTKEKQEGSHRVAAEIVAGMIRGSKHWTLTMVSAGAVYDVEMMTRSLLARRALEEAHSLAA